MGNLIINHYSFEFGPENTLRFQSLKNFLEAGDHARKNGDVIHCTSDFFTHKYSWGHFYSDLAYSTWSKLRAEPFWEWLPQTLHQALMTFFYANPSGRSDYLSFEHFLNGYVDHNCGLLGCVCCEVQNLDVYDFSSWHVWKADYYQRNPEKFIWNDAYDNFLPNKGYSDQLLRLEIKKHEQEQALSEFTIGQAFHDKVMRPKGPDLRAYAVIMGTLIAEINHFIYEEDLSKKEQIASGNSPRKIFSNIDRFGERIYISIDHAHGMFEYHDSKGTHLGEFKFDGSFNSNADSTHNLLTL